MTTIESDAGAMPPAFSLRARWLGEPHSPQRWSYALWATALAMLLIGIALAEEGVGFQELSYTMSFLRMWGLEADDSWGPMSAAVAELRAHPATPLYQELFFAEHVKFQYPISSLLPLDLAQRATGLPWGTLISFLNRLSWFSVWAVGILSWRLFVASQAQATCKPAQSGSEELLVLWPILALTLLFYPLSRSWALGQVQTMMTLLCAIALLLWQSRRTAWAGLCIGLCCAIKPQMAVLILWGALRREWSMVAAASATFAVLGLAAGTRYGFHHYFDYLSVLSFLSQHGEAYFPNQSMNGLLNRLLFNGVNLTFELHAFPDFNPVVYAGTMIATVAILGTVLLWRRRETPGVLDLAAIMLAATIASPIAWEHHYGVLLPIFAVMAPACLVRKPFGAASGAVLFAAFVVAGNRFDVTNLLAGTSLNVLQSYLFFAAVVVLVMLISLARLEGAGRTSPTPA